MPLLSSVFESLKLHAASPLQMTFGSSVLLLQQENDDMLGYKMIVLNVGSRAKDDAAV